MAFQWVFDTAATISMIERNSVGQTITRNNTVRAVSRGNGIMRFTVQMPAGLRWSDVADEIALIDAAGMHTVENVQLSNANYTAWMHNGDFTPGQNWDVIAVQVPTWTIFDRDLVRFDGPFIFYESVV